MAKHAISYFDKSFAATSRLVVEAAFSKSNSVDQKPRPWSKHSEGSSRYDALHETKVTVVDKHAKKKKKGDEGSESAVVDEALEKKKKEFLDVMMGAKKSSSNTFWANDDGNGDSEMKDEKETPTNDSGDEVVDDDEKNGDSDSNSEESDSDSDDDSFDVMKNYKKDARTSQPVSDMDFLRSKVVSEKEILSDGEDKEENGNESDSESGSDSSSAPSSSDDESDDSSDDEDGNAIENEGNDSTAKKGKMNDDAGDTTEEPITTERLFIRNLPFSATEDEIKEAFSPFGTIVECHIPIDDKGRNKGYAFVKFTTSDEAANAKESLDGSPFQGRLIHILPSRKEKGGDEEADVNTENMTHKMKMELERKKNAEKDTKGWSSSFVRGDAVVDNLASRLGLDKGAILNVKDGLSSGNAAVRLALGETQVIEENRNYFKNHGVDMDALVSTTKENPSMKRSRNMILVKNLPFDTSHDEISKIFIAVGGNSPPNVLLPPSKTIALVTFANNNDAKRCFRKLAYKRFKTVPLYLEWAPLCSVEVGQDSPDSKSTSLSVKEKSMPQIDDHEEDAEADGNTTSIYVKNLNFRTTEDTLKNIVLESVGQVRAVRIPTKFAPSRGSKSSENLIKQSMGYGFIEFNSEAAAKKALSSLQGKVVDGHTLELSMSKKGNSSSSSSSSSRLSLKKKPSSKLIVRNVPFQASRTEILQLFGSFGQLKKCRLPKKFDGGHRGFAFVEFTGAKEALNAMKSLSQTHLYGRHLVLEWADDKEDIDTLRDKAKRDSSVAGFSQMPKNKKIRFD